jgi:outer membrane protein assembly factor BamB
MKFQRHHISGLGCFLFFTLIGAVAFGQVRFIPEKPLGQWITQIKTPFFASPVTDGDQVFIGGLDSQLYSLDIKSGRTLWTFKTGGEIRSNVCLSGDTLYLNGGDGYVYAISRKSGSLFWKFATEGEAKYDFADYFHSTPVLHKGTLFFGSGDRSFYALNARTGQLVWKHKTGGIIHTTPAIDHNRIFFGSFDGYVYALNLADGSLAWRFKTVGHRYFPKGEVQGSPAVSGGKVFIGARDYNVYALDQEKGYCHWNKAFTLGWGLNNNIRDSVLYIGSADERVLIAADPASGEEYWKIPMEFLVFGNNAYTDSLLFVGTTNGKVHAISRSSGTKKWSFETDSYKKYRSDYFKADDSYRDDIYSIIKSNEQFLETEIILGGVFSTPLLHSNLLIFSSTEGAIYCLKIQ